GSPDMPQNTHDNDVGVVRINHDVGDLAGISKSHESPGGASIGREVDPFAGNQIVAGIRLARPHPHQIGIGGGQGNRANGDSSFFFKDGLPGESAILGHEHAASTRPGIIDVGLAWYSYHGRDAPSTYSWTQIAELHVLQGINGLVVLRFFGQFIVRNWSGLVRVRLLREQALAAKYEQ